MQILAHSVTPKSILLIGAHCDDIEIGCGATVLHLVERFPEAHFDWVVFSSTPTRYQEATRSADLLLTGARSRNIIIKNFRNGYFPYVGDQIKDYFEILKTQTNPDWIFTHYGDDLHQDHRIISELTWNTFRNHLIFEYEIPKYDGGLGSPNCFIPVRQSLADKKIDMLMDYFVSEATKQWFSRDTFSAMLRIRGIECNSVTGLAEAFYCRKFLM
ncbi:MAG TPA: PIG-L family deacetylase [Pseudomonadales bacterium]|nr:PIG-L family deacetylase [Pseudomonadales bacterium]